MNNNQWEVIIIGAGLGGLAAAARVAKAGKKVLVLEQSDGPGGYAKGLQRGDFYFDFSLHSMDGVAPGGWAYLTLEKLGVLDYVEFERLDPYYIAQFPDREITAYANPFAYEGELIRHFPKEAKGIRALFDEMVEVYKDAQRGRVNHALEYYPSPEEMLELHRHIIQAVGTSWKNFLDQYLQDPKLKTIVSTLWSYGGMPPTSLSAAMLSLLWVSAHHYGGFYPRNGARAVVNALEEIIKTNGGEILYNQRVTQLLIEDGVAVGVITEQGFEARAKVFVSNANAPDTLLNFVDENDLPSGYRNRVKNTPNSLSSFNIYLGLECDLTDLNWPHHQTFIFEDYDLEAQYEATLACDWERIPLILVQQSVTNPAAAPPGCSTLTIMGLAPWDYKNVWGTGGEFTNSHENETYQKLKQQVADILLARVEKRIPGLQSAIKYMEIATPLTNARYTMSLGGAIYGSEQSVENMYLFRLNEETPIPNLFLAGAWTLPGGGQSAALLSGLDGGGHCLLYLDEKREAAFFTDMDHEVAAATHTYKAEEQSNGAFFPSGQNAPDFTLTAVGSNQIINLEYCQGKPVILVFVDQNTTGFIEQINDAVRSQFPMASQAVVVIVMCLGNVPKLFHKLINVALHRAYAQASKAIPDLFEPDDYVIILPDWIGEMEKKFQVPAVSKQAATVVIDRMGIVQGSFHGPKVIEATLHKLKWL